MDTNSTQILLDKLDLIAWIYAINDTSIIQNLKNIKQQNTLNSYENLLKPMSENELISKAEKSNNDIKNDKVITQKDLIEEIKSW